MGDGSSSVRVRAMEALILCVCDGDVAISHQRLRSDLHQHPENILVTVLTDSDASAVVSAAVLCC